MEKYYVNKMIFRVNKDIKNWYFHFRKWRFLIQLAWDSRKDWFWLFQYANKILWEEDSKIFVNLLKRVLHWMAEKNAEIFTLYEGEERIAPKEVL